MKNKIKPVDYSLIRTEYLGSDFHSAGSGSMWVLWSSFHPRGQRSWPLTFSTDIRKETESTLKPNKKCSVQIKDHDFIRLNSSLIYKHSEDFVQSGCASPYRVNCKTTGLQKLWAQKEDATPQQLTIIYKLTGKIKPTQCSFCIFIYMETRGGGTHGRALTCTNVVAMQRFGRK